MVTGESRPVAKGLGDRVVAGTVSTDSTLRVRVDAIGERPLSIDGQVEDISISGEVALLTNLQRTGNVTRGTLSRMPLAGGAPRAVLEAVGSASWGPARRTNCSARVSG